VKKAEEVCPIIPLANLQHLINVLTLDYCSETTYKNATHILQQLSANPANREILLTGLTNAAESMAEVVMRNLGVLCDELKSSINPTLILSMASSTQELNLLRIIKTIMALAPNASEEVLRKLKLDLLWDALEDCLDIINDELEAEKEKAKLKAKNKDKGKEKEKDEKESKTPAANLLLPMIEIFFVVNAQEPNAVKRSGSTLSLATAASGSATALPSSSSSSSLAGGTSLTRSTSGLRNSISGTNLASIPRSGSLYNVGGEVQSRFVLFSMRYRNLLNDLVRQNPALLLGTFKILLKYPRALDFDNKRVYFRNQLQKLKDNRGYYGGCRLKIRRNKVFEDSFNQMRSRTPEELRGRLTIQFQGEEGIDAGGLSREWFDILAKEMFNPDYALFTPTMQDNSTFQPLSSSYVNPDHLIYFKFVGRVIGKAILDGQFLPCHFTRSFYKHMLGVTVHPSDMEAIDPQYYKNLRWILENDPEDLDLTFSAEIDDFGTMKVVELKEGGKTIPVTEENKHEYVQLITEMKMTTSIRSQIDAFLDGFHELIPKDLIAIFNERELELLISGLPEIDMEDLRANTEYAGFTESSPAIQWFWKAVTSFGQEERAKLVQFVTGTSRVPLDGFKSLRGISGPQKFQIHKAYRTDHLPSAHTCFNQLDLPEYESFERLREALLFAIQETEGFGFV